jgi:phosphomevalonate kinase
MTAPWIARAPGKLVLSGAYAVLEGAPAIVTAVDRYVEADGGRPAQFVTEEMRAADSGPYATFDASALRENDRKLGLGSSAAILVATLATRGDLALGSDSDLDQLFRTALLAHRRAQGGGSGIDVAASVFGGTLLYRLPRPLRDSRVAEERAAAENAAQIARLELPNGLSVEAWASPHAAKTSEFIAAVERWRAVNPPDYTKLMSDLGAAGERAVAACTADDAVGFIDALGSQETGLAALGAFSRVPIVLPEIEELNAQARRVGGVVIPAGAGGGDISLYIAPRAAEGALREQARNAGLRPLGLSVGAPGVHRTR